MKTDNKSRKYTAWLSSETMHNSSKKWLSEIEFAKDEQLFFDDLVKSYTLQLIDSKHFKESRRIITQLDKLHRETDELLDSLKKHEKGLKIMVDGKDEIELENAYKSEHAKLIIAVSDFLENYRTLKKQLFALVKSIMKEMKQKRLLN